MTKVYCFDLDGTLCTLTNGNYSEAKPIKKRIKLLNELYSSGNKIIINTARGFITGLEWEEITKKQLNEWGVNYHSLYLNKPAADYYIDDKALEIKNWLENNYR